MPTTPAFPKAFQHDPYRRRAMAHAAQLRRADAHTEAAADRPKGFGIGAKGGYVVNLKKHLNAAGYDVGEPNDTFGARTRLAVMAFQKHAGLEVTGVVDGATWEKLDRALFAAKSNTSPPQRVGERGTVVKKVEQKLKEAGFGPGEVDGFFSEKTADAVRAFQRRHDLKATGAVNGRTLKLLNKELGPDLGPTFTGTAYRNGQPYDIKLVKVDGLSMSLPTGAAFLKMKAAAKKDGVNLDVVSGFRTMAQQQALWNRYGPPRAARPGYSNHQSGLALDIETANGTNAAFRWLTNNARRFGFVRTVSFEPWHWEYRP